MLYKKESVNKLGYKIYSGLYQIQYTNQLMLLVKNTDYNAASHQMT